MAERIPDKAYFKIGEAARIVGVPAYVLRYWETEFQVLRPEKSKSNHRVYHRQDIERLLLVKRLLYQEGFTIAGARRALRGESRREDTVKVSELSSSHERVRKAVSRALQEGRQVLAMLDKYSVDDEE